MAATPLADDDIVLGRAARSCSWIRPGCRPYRWRCRPPSSAVLPHLLASPEYAALRDRRRP
ncbi:MAG: hypothetical protein R2731_03635 [Nocardioides sp.]